MGVIAFGLALNKGWQNGVMMGEGVPPKFRVGNTGIRESLAKFWVAPKAFSMSSGWDFL